MKQMLLTGIFSKALTISKTSPLFKGRDGSDLPIDKSFRFCFLLVELGWLPHSLRRHKVLPFLNIIINGLAQEPFK